MHLQRTIGNRAVEKLSKVGQITPLVQHQSEEDEDLQIKPEPGLFFAGERNIEA